jgi:hypothetical protein
MRCNQTGRKWQHGGATNLVLVRSHARARAPTHTPTSARTRAHAHIHTHTHTHTEICNSYCFSTATVVSWTRLNVMLYVHCLSCLSCGEATVIGQKSVTMLGVPKAVWYLQNTRNYTRKRQNILPDAASNRENATTSTAPPCFMHVTTIPLNVSSDSCLSMECDDESLWTKKHENVYIKHSLIDYSQTNWSSRDDGHKSLY